MCPCCPACQEPCEVTSLFMYLWAHWCEVANSYIYTNGTLFSKDHNEITGVSRGRVLRA